MSSEDAGREKPKYEPPVVVRFELPKVASGKCQSGSGDLSGECRNGGTPGPGGECRNGGLGHQ